MKILFHFTYVFTLLFLSEKAFSFNGIKDFETTRTKSLSGAGVGSILLNEAPLLNPASIVFLSNSSFYFQKDTDELDKKSEQRNKKYQSINNDLIVITDTSSILKGGISYQYQNEPNGKRIRYSASFAKNAGKRSSIGVSLRHSQEDSLLLKESYTQAVLGFTHIPKQGFNLGATIVDPTQSTKEYFKYTVGTQITIHDYIDLIVDFGSGDVDNPKKESFSKWSLQLQSFKRFFLRYGQFYDRLYNEKGSAVGLSWVGPKFSVDYALKNYSIIKSQTSDQLFTNDNIQETSIGLTILL
ncbi:MAG: hypothetical protein QF441_14795 [Bacteriovoracaceae bacterium]|jgi:hypothetical protein|nr:hypothetical protein [Bacteriovoracaceae bacterium]